MLQCECEMFKKKKIFMSLLLVLFYSKKCYKFDLTKKRQNTSIL